MKTKSLKISSYDCSFPGCINNRLKAKGKLFMSIPQDDRKLKWLHFLGIKSFKTGYMCADHFKVRKYLTVIAVYNVSLPLFAETDG